jgi:hypothetical protein
MPPRLAAIAAVHKGRRVLCRRVPRAVVRGSGGAVLGLVPIQGSRHDSESVQIALYKLPSTQYLLCERSQSADEAGIEMLTGCVLVQYLVCIKMREHSKVAIDLPLAFMKSSNSPCNRVRIRPKPKRRRLGPDLKKPGYSTRMY